MSAATRLGERAGRADDPPVVARSVIGIVLLVASLGVGPAMAVPFSFGDAGTVRSERIDVDVDALLMLDVVDVDGLYRDADVADGRLSVRRARIGLEVSPSADWELDLSVDLDPDEGEVSLHALSLGHAVSDRDTLDIGLIKQPFGLENLSSSRRLRTLERSIATRAFAPRRALGVAWTIDGRGNYGTVGAFSDRDDGTPSLAAHTTWAPIDTKRALVHLGAGLAWHRFDGDAFRIRDEGALEGGDNLIRSARHAPDAVITMAAEAALARDAFSLQSEWFVQQVDGDETTTGTARYDGFYLQAGWVLAGGRRTYGKGRFGDVKGGRLSRPVELVAGVSAVDLRHDGEGDRARQALFGANVRLAPHVRMAGQIQRLFVTDEEGDKRVGDAVQLRVQLEY